jgi:hypothetical protein
LKISSRQRECAERVRPALFSRSRHFPGKICTALVLLSETFTTKGASPFGDFLGSWFALYLRHPRLPAVASAKAANPW